MVLEFLKENWAIIIAIFTGLAYLLDKLLMWTKTRNEKIKSYKRVFAGLISYGNYYLGLKNVVVGGHQNGFLTAMSQNIGQAMDSLSEELAKYQSIMDKESQIVPEILLDRKNTFNLLKNIRGIYQVDKGTSEQELEMKLSALLTFIVVMDESIRKTICEQIEHIGKMAKIKKSQRIEFQGQFTEEGEQKINQLTEQFIQSFSEVVNYRNGKVEAEGD